MPLTYESPKQRFIKSRDRVEAHRFLVSHAQFDNSIDTALAEMQHELLRAFPATANDGAAAAFALVGAQKFVTTLKNLSELPEPAKVSRVGQLNHEA